MYTPPAFREDDPAILARIMRAARLSTLVTATAEGLLATPLPFILDEGEGEFGVLYGHLAKANPQWREAAPGASVHVARRIAIRFRGQTNHLDVALPDDRFDDAAYDRLIGEFGKQYEILFGRGAAFAQAGYEILSVQAAGSAALPPPAAASKGDPLKKAGSRKVVFDDPNNAVETQIFQTVYPPPGSQADGPCIIEFPGQSVVVAPGSRAIADEFGNLHVKRINS